MKIEVDLEDDLSAYLTASVAEGRFASVAAMLVVGAEMLRGRASEDDWKLAQLCRSLHAAEAGRPGRPAAEVFAELKARNRKAA